MTLAVVAAAFILQSCFTGIEHTGHINLSKKDKEIEKRISREEAFMADIKGENVTAWQPSREFKAVGDRASLAFDNTPPGMSGRTLQFASYTSTITPAGTKRVCLVFTDSASNTFRYTTGKQQPEAVKSTELPMLIDMQLVKQLRDKLVGRKLWTRTSEYISPAGEPVRGKKFEPVTVVDVTPGTEPLPYYIIFESDGGSRGGLLMSNSDGTLSTRPFHSLFSLSDPRLEYSGISDEVWQHIQAGNVACGMTKQECKLAVGAPDDTDSWHDYSKTIDVWTYANGIYLRFEEGLLVSFRK